MKQNCLISLRNEENIEKCSMIGVCSRWVVLPYVVDDEEYVDSLVSSCDPNKAT
jgi:hypothetical protein